LRKKHKLQVFENKVFKKISGPTKGEVYGEQRILDNKEFCDL
jgi:hypothetical protein